MLPPAGLELPEEVLPDSLVFRDASTRDVFSALGLFADVSVIFDPAFVDERLSVDLRGATLTTALTSVARSTRNFYRVTAPQTVTVIPDTPAKRREYEQEIVQTFYLSNAELPLPSDAPAAPRPVLSVDPQGPRQDRHRPAHRAASRACPALDRERTTA